MGGWENFLFGTVLVSLDFTCHQQQSTKCDIIFGICYFMRQQLESAKCVCYDLTPTKTHPYRHLPVNFNLLQQQQITFNQFPTFGSLVIIIVHSAKVGILL